jgi:anti-sigma factor RsiW
VTDATGHLPYWTLEQLADDDLPHRDRTVAEAHLHSCAACTAELARARAVVAALEGLPALAPSASFAAAVMERVRIMPEPAAAEAILPAPVPVPGARRWLPATVRGWMGLTAVLALVMAPLAMLGVWLAAHPLVSVGGAWRVARGWIVETAWNAVVSAAGALARSGAYAWAAEAAAGLPGPDAFGVPFLLLIAGATIPVAAYTMVRLLRTPLTGMTHAH